MKNMFLITAFIFASFVPAYANDEDTEIEIGFIAADIFPNGLIDGGEFDIYNIKTFETIDMDGSNSLDRDECMGDCFPNNITMDGTSGSAIRYPFRVLDANKSESVTPDEYLTHARKQFKIYDEDKNSGLNKGEFTAFYQGLKDRTFIAEKSEDGGDNEK
jgi:Ca2+-binding EF-hand superfamily protein